MNPIPEKPEGHPILAMALGTESPSLRFPRCWAPRSADLGTTFARVSAQNRSGGRVGGAGRDGQPFNHRWFIRAEPKALLRIVRCSTQLIATRALSFGRQNGDAESRGCAFFFLKLRARCR